MLPERLPRAFSDEDVLEIERPTYGELERRGGVFVVVCFELRRNGAELSNGTRELEDLSA
jgi:hypothetical protein